MSRGGFSLGFKNTHNLAHWVWVMFLFWLLGLVSSNNRGLLFWPSFHHFYLLSTHLLSLLSTCSGSLAPGVVTHIKRKKNIVLMGKKNKTNTSRYLTYQELRPELPANMEDVNNYMRTVMQRRRDRWPQVYTEIVPFNVALVSDSSGNVQQVFSNDPTNSAEWSDYSANWDSYRVLGIHASFVPNDIVGGSTATVRAPLAICTDYDDATGLTSYLLAETYTDHQLHKLSVPWTKTICERNIEASAFNDVIGASPTNQFWLKTFSSGNTASTTMGRMTIYYIVQFQGRGI